MKTFETEKHNIPEGATHYANETDTDCFIWYRENTKEVMVDGYVVNEWEPAGKDENLTDLKPIPQTKEVEWVNGLPPVGVECEFQYPKGRWNKGYYHGLTASKGLKMHILEYEGGRMETLGDLVTFRKPETEAERKEREELEAAYDLYCYAIDKETLFDSFCNFGPLKDIYLRIVRKTNYRVEGE